MATVTPGAALPRLLMCCCIGLVASACSLSFPMPSFVTDRTPTGSVDRASALLSKELDQEDWRRAKSAMAVALDPQGNGASVAWANPQSGAKGSFVALAPAFAQHDQVCRTFSAHVVPDARTDHDIAGSACRGPDGDWAVADAKELGKAKS